MEQNTNQLTQLTDGQEKKDASNEVSAEQKLLKASEARYRDLIENSTVGTAIFTSRNMVIDTVNDAMLQIWGKDRSITGKALLDAMPELKEQRFLAELQETYDTGISLLTEEGVAYISKYGAEPTPHWFQYSYRALYDIEGKVYGIINTATEITNVVVAKQMAREANEKLQNTVSKLSESREQLNLAIESAELGFWNLDPQTQKIIASPRLKELFGFYPDEEMLFEIAIANISDAYREGVVKAFEAAITEGKPYDIEYPVTGYRDGKLRWLRATGKLFKNDQYPDGNFSGTAADITERKTATETITQLNADLKTAVEKLSEQTEILELTIRSADIGLWQIDLVNNSTTLSKRMKAIHGIPPDREITFDEALSTVSEEFRQSVNEKVVKAIETGELFAADYKIHCFDGTGTGWVRSTGIVKQIGKDGRKVLIGACIDITERKRDEQRKNDFIGMVSHEMKTPLTSLTGYLQVLGMNSKEDGFTAGMVGKANKQVSRMTTLINGFLNVSRLEAGKIYIDRKRFDMAELVKETEEETKSLYNTHTIIFAPVDTTYVDADRDKIGQVMNNLISNAVKYSPARTTIQVACVTEDGRATFSVKDEGIGIKKENQPKLFERFYRVSEASNAPGGFGIGLYLCAEIIQRHNGKIWVESEVGKGSTFLFNLPVIG